MSISLGVDLYSLARRFWGVVWPGMVHHNGVVMMKEWEGVCVCACGGKTEKYYV
jgi:hypothetical protein